VAAVEYLRKADLDSRVFNELGFGSYLIWAASPRYQVYIDPRMELYTLELSYDYLDISAARPGWEARLDKYGVGALLLSQAEQQPLIQAARNSTSWREVYADATAAVFRREE
jgi:hypothetical protein